MCCDQFLILFFFQTLRDSLWKARDDAATSEKQSQELVKEAKKGTKVCMHISVVDKVIVLLVCIGKNNCCS